MTGAERKIVTASVGGLVYVLSALFAQIAGWPVLWYLPVARGWALAPHPPTGVLGMDLYGRYLLAGVLGAVAAGVTWAATGRMAKSDAKDAADPIPAVFWVALLVFAGVSLTFIILLATRSLTPPPLPDWYVPR